jgi:lysozyme family protein
MPSTFDIAIEKTLAHEGGYVNDPSDPGGETNFGISKRAYPDLPISALTRDLAITIYHRDYWKTPGFDQIENPALATKLFDLGVNMGTIRAVKLLQQATNHFNPVLAVDGILGPATAIAVNDFPHPMALLMALKIEAGNHYIKLGMPRFLAGWLNRLAE